MSPESAAMKSCSRTVPSAAPGPLNAKSRASVSCSCSLSPLSARTLLALLEECNPGASNNRGDLRRGAPLEVRLERRDAGGDEVARAAAALAQLLDPLRRGVAAVALEPGRHRVQLPAAPRRWSVLASPVQLISQASTGLTGAARPRQIAATAIVAREAHMMVSPRLAPPEVRLSICAWIQLEVKRCAYASARYLSSVYL